MKNQTIDYLRTEFHKYVCRAVLCLNEAGIPNIADKNNSASIKYAQGIAARLKHPTALSAPSEQGAGAIFGSTVMDFLAKSTQLLSEIRPGNWVFSDKPGKWGIASYYQYSHLAELSELQRTNAAIATALGNDYLVKPDIVMLKNPLASDRLKALIGSDMVARNSPFLAQNNSTGLLHASISCKWTIRSDRAQNVRTEALNLLRNRKGSCPHIVAVTMEPTPNRIASIAMGTGDIDCTYHGALHELQEAVEEVGYEEHVRLLQQLILGKRLRDISDLPFDLLA